MRRASDRVISDSLNAASFTASETVWLHGPVTWMVHI